MEELELGDGMGGVMSPVARVIKEGSEEEYSDKSYTNRYTEWRRTTFVGALLGKSGRAAQVLDVISGAKFGYSVPKLEGEE